MVSRVPLSTVQVADFWQALHESLWAIFFRLCLLGITFAQFPPPQSSFSDVKVLQSPANKDITIRFKSPLPGTCTTVFATQKQYTGFVTIPPDDVVSAPNTYPINTFFWFIEARQEPEKAPLTIWLNGGPGSSSMIVFSRKMVRVRWWSLQKTNSALLPVTGDGIEAVTCSTLTSQSRLAFLMTS